MCVYLPGLSRATMTATRSPACSPLVTASTPGTNSCAPRSTASPALRLITTCFAAEGERQQPVAEKQKLNKLPRQDETTRFVGRKHYCVFMTESMMLDLDKPGFIGVTAGQLLV